jgi:hypothetical protein
MNNRLYKLIRNPLTIPFTPFYRRYPYRNGIALDSADARGCIDLERGFFYNRIPKAANSTIVENLAILSFGKNIPSKDAKKQFRTPSQLSAQEVAQIAHIFRFAVVRNPFTRTLSAYLDKVERRAKRNHQASSFKDFLYGLAEQSLYRNAHWAPQSSLLLLPHAHFDFFGKVENLEYDLAFIKEKISGGCRNITPPKHFEANATGATKKLSQYYDHESVEIVRSLFRLDFDLFNYSPEFDPRAFSNHRQ